jgi:Epoxide hydrolase N terminus
MGKTETCNDVATWAYADLPKVLRPDTTARSFVVKTVADLGKALSAPNDSLIFVESIMDPHDGLGVHFIHVQSRHEGALPLIITHGWPGSVIELLGVVGPLTDPTAHGGAAEDAFDLFATEIRAAFRSLR